MGSLCCDAIEATSDLDLVGRYAPGHGFDDFEVLKAAEVIVEFGPPPPLSTMFGSGTPSADMS
jgi:hypothetical protein